MASSQGRPPFPFFVGCGRSGTTLLRAMFDSHSQMAVPPESWFVTAMARRRRRYVRADRLDHDRFLAENVGNGPAIDLKFVSTAAGATIQWDALPNVQTMLNGACLPIEERPSLGR